MRFALVALFAAIAAPALAADLPTLPSTGADRQPTEPDWKGFYIGSGVSLSSIRGAKGQVGGDIFAGYDHVYSNGVVLGLQFALRIGCRTVPRTLSPEDVIEIGVGMMVHAGAEIHESVWPLDQRGQNVCG